jgi:hypothetical protein
MLNVIMLGVAFYLLLSERRYAECRYAKCRYAECRGASLRQFNRLFQHHFKAVSTGLVYGDHAYFKSGWNVMDGSLVSGL